MYYDYAVDRGVIVMNRRTFVKYFGDLAPSGIAAYLRDGADPERVRDEIIGKLDEGHRAFIYTNRGLRAEVLRIFDSTFAITYALEIIAVVVAMLGVGATLLTLVIERRRELSMLRLIGAASRQVRRMVVIEAALIGAASQAIGLVVGLLLSLLLVYVINVQSFGWTIQFRVPVDVSRAGISRRNPRNGAGRRLSRRARRAARRDAGGVMKEHKHGMPGLKPGPLPRSMGFSAVRRAPSTWHPGGPAGTLRTVVAGCAQRSDLAQRDSWLSFRLPARSLQSSGLQDRVVVLHRQSANRRGPATGLSGDVFSRRRRSVARESVAMGGARSLHDAPGRVRSVRQSLSLSGAPQSRRPWPGRRRDGAVSRVERRLVGVARCQWPSRDSRGRCDRGGVDLVLDEGKAPAINGIDGISQKGAQTGNASHYYSLTRMPTRGVVVVDGERFEATGESWMDHEFGTSFLEAEQQGWDWLSIQLADGRELMLYQLRRGDGSRDPRSSGTLVDASGRTRHLSSADFTMTTTGRAFRAPSGATYPIRWMVQIPGESLTLDVSTPLENQELSTEAARVSYWEGLIDIAGTSRGAPIAGRGYLEMTGYRGSLGRVLSGR